MTTQFHRAENSKLANWSTIFWTLFNPKVYFRVQTYHPLYSSLSETATDNFKITFTLDSSLYFILLSGFPIKILYLFLIYSIRAIGPVLITHFDLTVLIIFSELHTLWTLHYVIRSTFLIRASYNSFTSRILKQSNDSDRSSPSHYR